MPKNAKKDLNSGESSQSSSNQQSQLSQASAEVKSMMSNATSMKKVSDLLNKVEMQMDSATIIECLKAYVSYISDTAQAMMDSGNLKPAQQILRGCEKCLKNTLPSEYTYSEGFLFTVNNNLAQLANRLGDVQLSVKYLEAAVSTSLDPRVQNRDELPLAETYLNIANAHSFLGKFDEAINFAEKAEQYAGQQCSRLEQALDMSMQGADADTLNEQYNCQINLKIMSLHAKGTNYEKLQEFQKAIAQFQAGKQLVEITFGTEHQLYAVFSSAMGGAKLKTKYQTPQDNKRTKSNSKSRSRSDSSDEIKKQKSSIFPKIQTKERKSSAARPQSGKVQIKAKKVTRKIPTTGIKRKDSASTIDSEFKRISQASNLTLMMSTGFKDSAIIKSRKHHNSSIKSNSSQGRYPKEDIRYMQKMRKTSSNKKVVCKNGPNCLNHDWNNRSPIKKVCQRDSNCVNHDWSKVDRQNSPFKVVCKKGPKCSNHDWTKRSPMHRSMSEAAPPQIGEPQQPPLQKSQSSYKIPQQLTEDSHQCSMHHSELMYQQQMATMKQMQEEQFKILELVMSKQQTGCQGHHGHLQHSSSQQSMMMKPHMMYPPYPQHMMYGGGGGGYMMPPQMADQFQTSTQQQSDFIRATYKSKSKRSYSSSQQEEDSSSSEPEPKPKLKKNRHKSKSIEKIAAEPEIVDVYELPVQRPVMEQTSHEHFKSNSHYDESYKDLESFKTLPRLSKSHSLELVAIPQPTTTQFEVKSAKSHTSFLSFHAEFTPLETNPNEAALIIQKNWRRHHCQNNYNNSVRVKTQSILFRGILANQALTCFQVVQGDYLKVLKFQTRTQKILLEFNIILPENLADKVKKIIANAKSLNDLKLLLEQQSLAGQNQDFKLNQYEEDKYEPDRSFSRSSSSSRDSSPEVVDRRRLRQTQIEQEIEMIKQKNHFDGLEIDPYHQDNQEELARSPLRPNTGIEPVVIERVMVNQKNDSGIDILSSSYSSENSYQFQPQKQEIMFKQSPAKILPNLQQIITIQKLVRGFLARKSFQFQRSTIIFNDKIEKIKTIWFCKLIRFGKDRYSLTVRLASDSHQQMIKRFKKLPFDLADVDQVLVQALEIIIKDNEWVAIDLIWPKPTQKPILKSQKSFVPETPTAKQVLLFLDIKRDEGIFRVSVHKRRDPNFPYQLKVNPVKHPEQQITHNMGALGGDSYSIREQIWNHLQVNLKGGILCDVYFSKDKVQQVIAQRPQKTQADSQAVIPLEQNKSNSSHKVLVPLLISSPSSQSHDLSKDSPGLEIESDGSFKSDQPSESLSGVKKLKPVKAKVMVVDGDQMFVCQFQGEITTNQYTLTLNNLKTKKQLFCKAPVKCNFFTEMVDKLEALDKVKARLQDLIKLNNSTLVEGSSEVPPWLQVIE